MVLGFVLQLRDVNVQLLELGHDILNSARMVRRHPHVVDLGSQLVQHVLPLIRSFPVLFLGQVLIERPVGQAREIAICHAQREQLTSGLRDACVSRRRAGRGGHAKPQVAAYLWRRISRAAVPRMRSFSASDSL